MPHIRQYINELMRQAVHEGTYIAEGRDLGTAVFPNADLKFYMSADVAERARRRYEEQKAANPKLTLDEVKQNIEQRDFKDDSMASDPLKKAEDAIEIDTTNIVFVEHVDLICSHISDLMDSYLVEL